MKNLFKYFFAFLLITVFGCEPEVEDKISLGETPTASFDIVSGSTPNDFTLVNTTEGAFITQWVVQSNGTFEGETSEISIPLKGDYEVTMTTFNSGGSSSLTKTLVVTEDDPNNCFGNMEILTGCDQKVWKVASEAGALNVGSNIEESWWGNSEADLVDRACLFNDEYIFKANGEFVYDNKGDFWADTDGNGDIWPSDMDLDPGCHAGTEWPEKYNAWDSGSHSFTINNESITVAGEGAHLGLYKVGTSGEVMSPQSSVTLSIHEISETRMVLFADYSGVVWRLTFVAQ